MNRLQMKVLKEGAVQVDPVDLQARQVAANALALASEADVDQVAREALADYATLQDLEERLQGSSGQVSSGQMVSRYVIGEADVAPGYTVNVPLHAVSDPAERLVNNRLRFTEPAALLLLLSLFNDTFVGPTSVELQALETDDDDVAYVHRIDTRMVERLNKGVVCFVGLVPLQRVSPSTPRFLSVRLKSHDERLLLSSRRFDLTVIDL